MENRKIQKLALLCVSVFLCGLAAWWSGDREAEQQARREVAQNARFAGTAAVSAPAEVTVCVSGAVKSPGLYRVPKGSRGQDAITLAGGVTEDADLDKVNLAQLCKEGGHIKVPRLTQSRLRSMGKQGTGTLQVHLNTATAAELMRLPGVGEATARRILEYREKNRFVRIEDIMKVPGIGEGRFTRMKAYLFL